MEDQKNIGPTECDKGKLNELDISDHSRWWFLGPNKQPPCGRIWDSLQYQIGEKSELCADCNQGCAGAP